jgi:lysophospholipase L1-like esterase
MRRLLLFLLVPAVVVGLVAAFASTSDTTHSWGGWPPQFLHEYLALGDSLGTGHPYDEPSYPEYDPSKGYVSLFHNYLESRDPLHRPLLLNNLSIDGATTTSLISDELPAALADLEARNSDWWLFDDIKVVTVDIGGNDLLATIPYCMGGPTPECFAAHDAAFATISTNLDYTLDELREAAGPFTKIIVMTYYNGFVAQGCPYGALSWLAELALEGNPALGRPVGANDIIREVAAAHHAKVAELVPGGVFPALLGPSNILPDCVHANASGYQIIADAFADALESH